MPIFATELNFTGRAPQPDHQHCRAGTRATVSIGLHTRRATGLTGAEREESFTRTESVARWAREGRAAYDRVEPRPQKLEAGTRPGGRGYSRNRNLVPGSRQTRVPGYPECHTLFSPLLAFERRRVRRTRVRRTRVPGYPDYHKLFAPLFSFERWRGKAPTGTRVPGLPYTICSPLAFERRRGEAEGGKA